jgi:uncharacterized heparinase superfamily protein
MMFSRRFGLFHLACLRMFAPVSVLSQSMRSQRSAGSAWPQATPSMAGKLLKRRFDFAGCVVEMPVKITWQVAHASADWHRELYSFRWIHEVAASNNHKAASSLMREFMSGFMVHERAHHSVAWELDVVGARLAIWSQYRGFILKGSSKLFRKRLGRSWIKQALKLYHACEQGDAAVGWSAVLGLIAVGTHVSDMRFLLPAAYERLKDLLVTDILADGCHVSVSPEKHVEVLRTLIDIRFLLTPDTDVYHDVMKAIAAMGRVLTFFCHGDGRLALFHNSLLGDAGMIAAIRQLSSSSDAAVDWLPEAGFLRLEQQRTRVFMAVPSQKASFANQWQESRLAFELSEGSERIIVNCGAYRGNDVDWAQAMRTPQVYSGVAFEPSSAHHYAQEVASVDAVSAMARDMSDEAALRQDESLARGMQVRGDIKIHAGTSGIFAEASHDSSQEYVGITHQRHLHLSRKGDVLSGRDLLMVMAGVVPSVDPVLRFHLHPDIRCHRMKGGVVELKSVSGKGWHFSATSGIELQVNESVYLGYYGKPQKTLQIVLRPQIKSEKTMISWQFKRMNVAATVEQAQAILLADGLG